VNRLLGRGKSPGPSKNWVLSTLVALVLAFVAWIGIFTYQSVEVWTPLQQWYWVQYSISKNFPNPSGTYQVLSKLGSSSSTMHDGILFEVCTAANDNPQLNSMCALPISHSPSFSPMHLYCQFVSFLFLAKIHISSTIITHGH